MGVRRTLPDRAFDTVISRAVGMPPGPRRSGVVIAPGRTPIMPLDRRIVVIAFA
ncbi:hypothetical protein BX265_0177 [Streptomyces sp. TLI_235]|nr:hypothetical protein BX265_0177 [Streptomyces sp. TLI_235]